MFLRDFDFSKGNWTLLIHDNYEWGEMICNEEILDSFKMELHVEKECGATTPEIILSLYLADSLVSSHWYCDTNAIMKGNMAPFFSEVKRIERKFKYREDAIAFSDSMKKSTCYQTFSLNEISTYPLKTHDEEANKYTLTYFGIEE